MNRSISMDLWCHGAVNDFWTRSYELYTPVSTIQVDALECGQTRNLGRRRVGAATTHIKLICSDHF